MYREAQCSENTHILYYCIVDLLFGSIVIAVKLSIVSLLYSHDLIYMTSLGFQNVLPGIFYPLIMPYKGMECRNLDWFLTFFSLQIKVSKMATLYGSGKGCVRLMAGLQLLIGVIMFVFGVVVAVLVCHWTSKAGLGIWIGIIVS